MAVGVTFLVSAQAFAWSLGGELGIGTRGYDEDSNSLTRDREYQALPRDGYISVFEIGNLFEGHNLQYGFSGRNLGEDDVDSSMYIGYKSAIMARSSYTKIPHMLDVRNNYYTQRTREEHKVEANLSGSARVKVSSATEDKTGRRSSLDYVGQKTRSKSISAQGKLSSVQLLLSFGEEEFFNNNSAYEADVTAAYATIGATTKRKFQYGSHVKDLKPFMGNTAPGLKISANDFSNALYFGKNIYLLSFYSNQKRERESAGFLVFEDNYYSTSLNYKGALGRGGVSYKKVERDYSGGRISGEESETMTAEATTSLSFLGIKGKVEHGYKEVSGLPKDDLIIFSERESEFAESKVVVSLLGFEKFGLNYSENRKYKKYVPHNTYGTATGISVTQGFSSYYVADERSSYNLSYYILENKTSGRYKYWRWSDTSGLFDPIDSSLSIYNETEYLYFGGNYTYSERVSFQGDIFTSLTRALDPNGANRIRETSMSLSMTKLYPMDLSLRLGLTLSKYEEALYSGFAGGNAELDVELLKKF